MVEAQGAYAAALRWVLGEEGGRHMPASQTELTAKTRPHQSENSKQMC